MLRRKPVLILANLALAALVSGFTCVQINTPQGQLSTNGRLYAFQTPDNNLYCGLVDVFQLRDTKYWSTEMSQRLTARV